MMRRHVHTIGGVPHGPLTIWQELRQIEQEIHTEILPGTEIMADIGSHHFVKGGTHVLVPQPSADPHDPLVREGMRTWL